ncbi:lycopene cyclase domain-containing protein [Agreia sp. PsM10]|jgi:lycopene cyclase domain-containing protein|uniref:lycopene cyclase domain-containing protein n=1 Tax=Agreia sp. PsM10 TaxID=3030533 RepID=UPI00263A663A|nr:lycopene cyclase domain-containing protein [Agreia sp. PsM10]MDN4641918.1 lycopene cyclase domain-containing protein [Agreia sp. PsM10]
MGLLYLLALLVSITGMVVLDRRFGLFFFRDARRASIVLVAGLVFFVGWDLAGIGLGIFFRGETSFMTGLQLAPELPVEEIFFLTLLCYLTMNLFGFLTRASAGRAAGGRAGAARRDEVRP